MRKSRKILIADYETALEASYDITIEALKKSMGSFFDSYEVEVYAYENDAKLIEKLKGCEGLITGFIEMHQGIIKELPDLRCISVSGVGYSNIDLEAARQQGIRVCHIAEYCTEEVAEHALALIQALNRNFKYYGDRIEKGHEWKYHTISGGHTLSRQTIGIFGLGKIGRRVATLAQAFGMKAVAYDPYINKELAEEVGVELLSAEEIFSRADVISNHMNLTSENAGFFNYEAFSKMSAKPIFINVGRGGSMVEKDLVKALDEGLIRGAGLDVLEAEDPDLASCQLLNRANVIITPHSAFYSDDSIEALQRISGENLGYCLTGQFERLFSEV